MNSAINLIIAIAQLQLAN